MDLLLQQNLSEIQQVCKAWHVKTLHAFGSVLRDDFSASSDIDFVVVFDTMAEMNAFDQFFGFKEALELLLDREIDLISGHVLTNPYFIQELEATKLPVYAA